MTLTLTERLSGEIGVDFDEFIGATLTGIRTLQRNDERRERTMRALLAQRDGHLFAFENVKAARRAGEQLKDFIAKAQSGNLNTLGGFLVSEEWQNAIADVRDLVGVARKLAQVVPMTTDSLSYPKFGTGVSTSYVTEGATPNDVTSSGDLVKLNTKKLMAFIKASSEVMEDAATFADFIASSLAYALEKAIDDAFFKGDGTSTYGGISGLSGTAFPSGGAGLVAAASGHSALSSIDNTDLGTLIGSLPAAFHDNAWFVMHPVVWGQLCVRLLATAGASLADQAGRRALNGYPVALTGSMPSATSSLTGKIVMAFGDLKRASMLGLRRDARIDYSDSRLLDADQFAIRGTTRFDVIHHGLGTASSAGAVVALTGN